MPKNPIEKVEIVEPPLGELTKKTYTWKRSCFTSCSSIVIFILIIIVGLRLYLGSGPTTTKTLPANFPSQIPLYDKDSVENIIIISGQYKTRGIIVSAFFPKLLLSPLFYNDGSDNRALSTSNAFSSLTTPITDNRETIRIVWRDLNAEASFVASYYKNEFRKSGFQISNEVNTYQEKQFSFSKDTTDGEFYIHSDPGKKTGSDFASLTVHVPSNP